MTPETALLGEVRRLLKADAGVTALVAGKVFDAVPNDRRPGQEAPYIYAGPINRQRVYLECGTAWQIRMRIYAVTTTSGRDQGWEVIEAIVQALDGKDADVVTIPAPFSLQNRLDVTQAGDVVDPLAPKSMFVDLTTTIARDTLIEEPLG
ncbi:DUF3168 domain-containing protein [Methylobacterium nodulans]|uniref:DUF3168 domain-containing protein n=1 Tax=Methylobacterium nodulans (strain LMG 21967 / CNCM I-2342 / ORS 2060) TaxID=460265 RepID=B8ITA5_METNO|nr:DUF3168 domain-containing protein [Methylobacterium nodulans]ACL56991.1 hypothetical protein Mnod_2004 [Methylobacterium nodulans ORS 2060]